MTERALSRVRAAYPELPDPEAPRATIARLQSLYAQPATTPGAGVRVRRPRGRWRPPHRIGLLTIGAVIVSGTALAATGGWHPLLGSSDRAPRPLAAGGGVPASQLAALAVLRREQTAADRGPVVERGLRVLSRQTINGIHTDAIRVISQGPRELSMLVPVERVGSRLPDVPASRSIQQNVLCLMSTSRQDKPRRLTTTHDGRPRTLHFPAGFSGWGLTCGNLQTLSTTGIRTGTSPDGSGGLVTDGHPERITTRWVTLVPDGVVRVTVRLPHGRSVTVPVRDNVYRYTLRGSSPFLGTVWFDASGRRIAHREGR